MKSPRSLLLWAVLVAGCATAPGVHTADVAKEKAALIQTDAEFSKMAQERGLAQAFVAYAAPDATMMPMNQNPVTGHEAVREHFADTLPGTTLVWRPFQADVAKSGDLGYTLGTYEFRAKGPDGRVMTHHGKYCSVWKKQPDGTWKWVVDIGNPSPEPK